MLSDEKVGKFVSFVSESGTDSGEVLSRLPDYYGPGKDAYHIAKYYTVPVEMVGPVRQ